MAAINQKSLEQALSLVAGVGRGETSFDIAGQTLALRIILPEEDTSAQRESLKSVEGMDEEDPFVGNVFMDAFKLAVLCRSLVQVGDLDLRNEDYVETGDTLPNGVAVKVARADALRKVLGSWGRPARDLVFRKYAELLIRVEMEAEAQIQFDPVNLDTEIDRLESRLADLRKERDEQAKPLTSSFSTKVRAALDDMQARDEGASAALTSAIIGTQPGRAPLDEVEDQAPPPPAPQMSVAAQAATDFLASRRRQAQWDGPAPDAEAFGHVPHHRPLPTTAPQQAVQPTPARPQIAQPQIARRDERVDLLPDVEDSMLGGNEEDEIALANARLMDARRRAGLTLGTIQAPAAPEAAGFARRAPHADALQAEADVGALSASGAVVLSRQGTRGSVSKAGLDNAEAGAGLNPRFRKPG